MTGSFPIEWPFGRSRRCCTHSRLHFGQIRVSRGRKSLTSDIDGFSRRIEGLSEVAFHEAYGSKDQYGASLFEGVRARAGIVLLVVTAAIAT